MDQDGRLLDFHGEEITIRLLIYGAIKKYDNKTEEGYNFFVRE